MYLGRQLTICYNCSSQRLLPDNTRHSKQTNIYAPDGIRSHDLSRRLKMDSPYPIERAEKIQTRYGETVFLTLKESPQAFVKVFLSKCYGELFTKEKDL
jgi:hypothetical protein